MRKYWVFLFIFAFSGCIGLKGVYNEKWMFGHHTLTIFDNRNFILEIGGCVGTTLFRGQYSKIRDTLFLNFSDLKYIGNDSSDWISLDTTEGIRRRMHLHLYDKLIVNDRTIYPLKRKNVTMEKINPNSFVKSDL